MKTASKLLPAVAILVVACTSALQTGSPGGTSAAISAQDLRTRLFIFADDSMLGRQFGTEGNLKGAQYIANELARMGVQPGGTGGTYFQDVPAFRVSMTPGSQVYVDGAALAFGTDYMTSFPATGRVIPVDSVQVIYGGDLSDTTTLISPNDVAGKAVLLSVRTPLIRSPNAILGRYAGARTIITAGEPRTVRPFGVTMSSDTTPLRVNLTVSPATAQRLLGADPGSATTGTVGRYIRFSSLGFTRQAAPARNVIGIIPGTDPELRGEYVAIGAHNDHLGVRYAGALDHDSLRAYNTMANRIVEARSHATPGTPGGGLTPAERASIHVNVDSLRRIRPARRDSIYNGADDDGSGSVGVLEIAEAFARSGTKPRRSLIFVVAHGRGGRATWIALFHRQPDCPARLDSRAAQYGYDRSRRGVRLCGRWTHVPAARRVTTSVDGARRHRRSGKPVGEHASQFRLCARREWSSGAHLLPKRSLQLCAVRHSNHVLHDRSAHGLPPAHRRAAVHRLRAHA